MKHFAGTFFGAPASYLWKVKLYCTELDISNTIVFLKFLKLRCLTIILFIIILMMAWYWCEDFSSIVVLWNLSHFNGANNLENIIIFFVVWKIIPEIENKISHQYYQYIVIILIHNIDLYSFVMICDEIGVVCVWSRILRKFLILCFIRLILYGFFFRVKCIKIG